MTGVLEGKVALVTGAGRGQGAAEARLMHREGAFVYAADVDERAIRELCVELGAGAEPITLDVRSDASWIAAIDCVRARQDHLDILVNNAAILGRFAPLLDLSADDVRAVLDVNIVGVFLGMKRAVPLMSAGASVVNIASVDGVTGMASLGHYSASKFAVRGLTRTAAIELGARGMRVNTVLPGAIDTPMIDPPGLGYDPRPALAKRVPLGRVGEGDEVAAVVVFLASDGASYCTGGEYPVDGGWLA